MKKLLLQPPLSPWFIKAERRNLKLFFPPSWECHECVVCLVCYLYTVYAWKLASPGVTIITQSKLEEIPTILFVRLSFYVSVRSSSFSLRPFVYSSQNMSAKEELYGYSSRRSNRKERGGGHWHKRELLTTTEVLLTEYTAEPNTCYRQSLWQTLRDVGFRTRR